MFHQPYITLRRALYVIKIALFELAVVGLSIGLAFGLQVYVSRYLINNVSPFALAIIPIAVSAWYGGMKAGTLATVIYGLLLKYYFLPTTHTFYFAQSHDLLHLLLFMTEGFVVSFVFETRYRSYKKLESTAEKLKASELKYKLVVENSGDLISICDTQGTYLYVSPSFERMLGYNAKDLIGKNKQDFIHPEDVLHMQFIREKALIEGKAPLATFRFRTAQGEWVILEGSSSAITDSNNKPQVTLSIARNITERQLAQEEVKKHLSLLHTVIEGISDSVIVKDLNGRYVLANSAAARLLNKSLDEIIGKTAFDIFPLETAKKIRESEEQALELEETITYEENIPIDGVDSTFLSSKSVHRDADNNIVGFVGISHDITERKKYEEQLQTLNTKIGNILDSITDAFFALDNDGKFVYLNKQAEHILKVKGEKVMGKSVWDELPDIIDSTFYRKYFRVVATQEPVTFEKYYAPYNRWFEIHAYPAKDGLSVYLNDITLRKETEEVLRENEERFRLLAESVPQIIWTARPDGSIDYYNKKWYDYTGLSYEISRGWGWKVVVHPEDLDESIDAWNRSLSTGRKFEVQYRMRCGRNQQYIWHLARAIPIKNKQGKIIRWFGTYTDINEQKKLDERKDEFISTASHELKTPITTIKAYTQLLQTKFSQEKHPETNLYLYKMNSQLDRLKNLTNNLLDVSKIQAGKLEFVDTYFDITQLVSETIEDIQTTISSHSIMLKGADQKVIVYGDRFRIGQILNNLISNGIKYSPQSDKLVVQMATNSRHCTIAIEDFGIGLAKEEVERIFDRFYRATAHDGRRFEGLGLGLHIANEIAKRHKGKIWVESVEGKGSIFYVSLPVEKQLPHYEKTYLSN